MLLPVLRRLRAPADQNYPDAGWSAGQQLAPSARSSSTTTTGGQPHCGLSSTTATTRPTSLIPAEAGAARSEHAAAARVRDPAQPALRRAPRSSRTTLTALTRRPSSSDDEEMTETRDVSDGEIYLVGPVRKYVLLRLDELLAQAARGHLPAQDITVEHVLPQNPKDDSEWRQDFTEDERLHGPTAGQPGAAEPGEEPRSAELRLRQEEAKYFTSANGVAASRSRRRCINAGRRGHRPSSQAVTRTSLQDCRRVGARADMATSNRDRIDQMFHVLARRSMTFILGVGPELPAGHDWTQLVRSRTPRTARTGKTYDAHRPAGAVPDADREHRAPGQAGLVSVRQASSARVQKSFASELREVRNEWAHNDSFTDDDAYRALDTAERLLARSAPLTQPMTSQGIRLNLRRVTADKDDRRA